MPKRSFSQNNPIQLYQGDCLDILPRLKSRSVDLVLCDPPYGTTQNEWDSVIPLDELWTELKRLTTFKATFAIMSNQPFTSFLILSNLDWFNYVWVWDKVNSKTGFLDCKRKPLKCIEEIVIFHRPGGHIYNPQLSEGTPYTAVAGTKSSNYGGQKDVTTINSGTRQPTNLLRIKAKGGPVQNLHPTQKPITLMEYLIKTYTHQGNTVLDFAMGSGTTGVACKKLGRKFIGIELNPDYFQVAQRRITES